MRWSEQLTESKHYLQLLVNAANNEKIANILKESIEEMPKKDTFFKRLVDNIVESKGEIGVISINVLSLAVKCLKGDSFVP